MCSNRAGNRVRSSIRTVVRGRDWAAALALRRRNSAFDLILRRNRGPGIALRRMIRDRGLEALPQFLKPLQICSRRWREVRMGAKALHQLFLNVFEE
jgi:hypothetical protein